MKTYYYTSRTPRSINSGVLFFHTPSEARQYAKDWSSLDGGRREITMYQIDEDGEDIAGTGFTYAGGELQK